MKIAAPHFVPLAINCIPKPKLATIRKNKANNLIALQAFIKVFQLKLFYNASVMRKMIVLHITLLYCVFNLNAQEKSNLRLGMETGPILFSDSENLAFFLNIELKLKSSKNTFIGLRIGATINSQTIENNDSCQLYIHEEADNGAISFVPTFDYYFNENNFCPYLGIGVGYYVLAGYVEVTQIGVANPSEDVFKVGVDNQVGFLFRGGFEFGKFRFGLEYNLVLKADIEMPNGQIIGTVDNSYFGLSIGYTIVGGKSSK